MSEALRPPLPPSGRSVYRQRSLRRPPPLAIPLVAALGTGEKVGVSAPPPPPSPAVGSRRLRRRARHSRPDDSARRPRRGASRWARSEVASLSTAAAPGASPTHRPVRRCEPPCAGTCGCCRGCMSPPWRGRTRNGCTPKQVAALRRAAAQQGGGAAKEPTRWPAAASRRTPDALVYPVPGRGARDDREQEGDGQERAGGGTRDTAHGDSGTRETREEPR